MKLKRITYKEEEFSDHSATWVNACLGKRYIGGYEENEKGKKYKAYIYTLDDESKERKFGY